MFLRFELVSWFIPMASVWLRQKLIPLSKPGYNIPFLMESVSTRHLHPDITIDDDHHQSSSPPSVPASGTGSPPASCTPAGSASSTARRWGGAGARASASCSLWRKVAARVATVFSASVCAFLRKDSDLERMFIWQGGYHRLEEC